MHKINWEVIFSNILEARIQLEQIEKGIETGKLVSESELQIMLAHAYHHMNFAWNAKRIATKRYADMKDSEFNKWGKFPQYFRLPELNVKKKGR